MPSEASPVVSSSVGGIAQSIICPTQYPADGIVSFSALDAIPAALQSLTAMLMTSLG